MKPTLPTSTRKTASLAAALGLSLTAHAATQTWQTAGPSNVWDTVTAGNWSTGPFVDGDSAVFGGTGETVDVSGNITVGGITFNVGGYSIADANNDGTLTLSDAAVITLPSATSTTTFSESLTAGNFTITRPSSTNQTANLNLSAANTITGTLSVTYAGSLGTMNLVSQTDNVTNANTILSLAGNTGTTVQFFLNGTSTTLGGLTNTGGSTRRFSNGTNPTLAGTLTLNVAAGSTYTYSSQVGNTLASTTNANRFHVVKTGDGLQEFTNAVAMTGTTAAGVGYFGDTTISQGALGFAPIAGVLGPTSSLVRLDGGVIQNTAAATFSRSLGSTAGTYLGTNGNFLMTANGGGFSAKGGTLTVNIGGAASTLDWGSTVGTQLVGPLKFGHTTSTAEVSFTNPINLNGAVRTIEVADNPASAGDFASLNGALADGSGSGGLNKTGAGLLVLNGLNTYTGTTSVSAGTLSAVAPAALPGYNTPGNISVSSGATLQLRAGGAGEFTESDLSAITTNASFAAGSLLGVEVLTGNTVTLASPLGQTNIGLRKDGAGDLNIASANTYSGGTVIAAGTVRISDNASLGSGSVTLGGGTLSSDGTTARTLANPLTISLASTLGNTANNGALTFTAPVDFAAGNRTVTIASDVVFAGGAANGRVGIKLGTGTLTFQGDTTPNGLIEIRDGSVVIDGNYQATDTIRVVNYPGTTSTLTVTAGSAVGINNGASNLRIGATGGSTTASNVADIYGSITHIIGNSTGGFVRFGQSNTNGTLNLYTGGLIVAKNISEETGSSGVSTLNFEGGTFRALSDDTAFVNTNLDAVNIGAGGAIFDSNGFSVTVPANLLHNAALGATVDGGVTKVGAGTLTLSGTNTYTGPTTVSAGTLIVGHASALGSGNVTVASGATLDLGSFAVANSISNNGGTLSGLSSYSGTQTVGGTASYSGSVGGTVTVVSGGTLKGTASFTGAVVFENGSVNAPGNSPGLQTFGAGVTYETGSTLEWEFVGDTLGLRGSDFDAIDVTGGDLEIQSGSFLALVASLVDYSSAEWDSSRSFSVIDYSGAGSSTGLFTLDTSGAGSFSGQGSWSLTTASGDVILTWTPVPEPSTWAALAGLGALALALRRRARHG